jgi:Fe-S-cluster containining protein
MNKKAAQKLIKEIKMGKHRKLGMSDVFQFECTACGKCCFNNEVLLNCYDLIRLRHALKASTNQILQEGLISFHVGPNSGLPVCTLNFQNLSPKFTKCPFLSPAIGKEAIKSKSEFKRVLALGAEIEKWLCSVHKDRPLACRFYPCGRIKSINDKTGKVEETFILQNVGDFCPGFKQPKKQSLRRYLNESEFQHYDDGSAKFASLVEMVVKSGFFVGTKDNKKKGGPEPLLKIDSKVFFILANIMYNFDSFNYFSNDEKVLKTITDKNATHVDYMYVMSKIKVMADYLIKLYHDNDGDEEAIIKIINSQPIKEVNKNAKD